MISSGRRSDGARKSYDVKGWAPAAHIFVLTGLAVAQPLYDLLSHGAEFFVARGALSIDPVLMALALSILLPSVLVLLARAASPLGATVCRWLHGSLVAGLSGLVALLVLESSPLGPVGSIAAAAGLAVAGTVLYFGSSSYRTFLTVLSPAALLFPLLFLFGSPVRKLVLPATVAGSDGQPGVDRPADAAPVVMVIFDALSLSSLLDEKNEVDPARYPNLAALARDATWFRDTVTASDNTLISVPIIVSGLLPARSGLLPQTTDHPDNLFTWLGDAGYRLNVVESRTRLCPSRLCSPRVPVRGLWRRLDELATDLAVIYLHRVLPDALTVRLPSIENRWSHFTERTLGTRLGLAREPDADPGAETDGIRHRDDVPGMFADFLEQVAPGDRPALHFIHMVLPHGPWRYLPSGREYGQQLFFPHDLARRSWKDMDEWEVGRVHQRHLLQVGYADRLLGRLVAKLKQQDLYESAVIVVVADHGVTFRARTRRRMVGRGRFADVLNVPLMIKLPGQQRPDWRNGVVGTVDVLPTLADALDFTLPWRTDGASALGSPRRSSDVTFRGKSWDLAALHASRARSVERKLRLFGSGEKPWGLFRIGPRADLVGRRIADLGIGQAAGRPPVTVELNEPWSFEALDPNAPIFPARVSGRVRFAQTRASPVDLAIAISGRIEAVTRTIDRDGDRARFTAMVRERALGAGRNLVEIFEIADGGSWPLVPVRQLGVAPFTLVETEGERAIRRPGGGLVPWILGNAGEAKLRTQGRRIWLEGRFAGPGVPPDATLLVFVDDRCVAVRDGELSRARVFGDGLSRTRFLIRLPDALTAGAVQIGRLHARVRLFALAANSAREITVS